jgi:hypothetical protein
MEDGGGERIRVLEIDVMISSNCVGCSTGEAQR